MGDGVWIGAGATILYVLFLFFFFLAFFLFSPCLCVLLLAGESQLLSCFSPFSLYRPGVTIGEDSTIGAGSVVTRDIPPRCVAFGNPAKVRYFISDDDPPAEQLRAAMTLDEALKMGREEKEEKVQSILL